MGNTWAEGGLWLLTPWIWYSYEPECVIETEPNAAFKIRNLSPFPTHTFEVASAQCINALIGLADLRLKFVSELEITFAKKLRCLYMYASSQKFSFLFLFRL